MAIVIDIVLRDPGVESKIKRLDERFARFTETVRALRYEVDALAKGLAAIGAVNVPRMPGGGGGSGGGPATGRSPRPVGPAVGSAFARISSPQQAGQAQAFISQVDALGGGATRAQLQARNRAMKSLTAYNKANDPHEILKAAILRTRWVNVFGRKIGMPLGVDAMKIASKLPQFKGMFGDLGQALGAGGAASGGGAVPPVIGAGGMAGAGGMGGAAGGMGKMLAGLKAAAGPIALVAAVMTTLAAAAKFAYGESERAVAAYRKQTIVMAAMGADARAASAMSMFERLAPGSTGAGSRSLSGMEASVAASIGLNPMTGLGGDMNYAERNRKIVRALRRAQTARKRQIILEAFPEMAGMAGAAQFLDNSDFERMMRGGRGMSERQRANAAKFDFENQRAGQNLGGLRDRFGANLAGPTGRVIGLINRILESPQARAMERMGEVGVASQTGTVGGVAMLLERLMDKISGIAGGGNETARQIERNTRQTAEWVKDVRDGIYGGGERAGRVAPRLGTNNYSGGAQRDVGSSLI